MRRRLTRQISKSSDELNSAEAVRRRSVPDRQEVQGGALARAPSLDTAIDEEKSEENSCPDISSILDPLGLDRWNGVLLRNSLLSSNSLRVLTLTFPAIFHV